MEDATPIFNLRNDSVKKEPLHVMSYNDVLKNVYQEPPSVQPPQQPPQPPQPMLHQPQVLATPTYQPVVDPAVPVVRSTKETTDENMKAFQNDMIVLLSVYVIVHMKSVQDWIQSKVPNLVNTSTGAMSVMGLLMNGILVIVLWNLSKNMVSKYLKEI